MATKLTKVVTRETLGMFEGRNLMAELDPTSAGTPVLTLWPKGTQRRYSISLEFLYSVAKNGGLAELSKTEATNLEKDVSNVPDVQLEMVETPAGEKADS